MKIDRAEGHLRRLRRTVASLEQRTFRTPLQRLEPFISCLLAQDPPFTTSAVLVDQVVFTPKHLEDLLTGHKLPLNYGEGQSIAAEDSQETVALLGAALADWLDFYFVPNPKKFILYADHDEYTTLFAVRKGTLSQLVGRLAQAGVSEVSGYHRDLSDPRGAA